MVDKQLVRMRKQLRKQQLAEAKAARKREKEERKESSRKSEIAKLKKETELYRARAKHRKAKEAAHHPLISFKKKKRAGKIRLF